jgi:hypothetical protein
LSYAKDINLTPFGVSAGNESNAGDTGSVLSLKSVFRQPAPLDRGPSPLSLLGIKLADRFTSIALRIGTSSLTTIHHLETILEVTN